MRNQAYVLVVIILYFVSNGKFAQSLDERLCIVKILTVRQLAVSSKSAIAVNGLNAGCRFCSIANTTLNCNELVLRVIKAYATRKVVSPCGTNTANSW